MKKLYLFLLLLCFGTLFAIDVCAQDCDNLNASFQAFESRCAATGAILVDVTGGSDSYKFKTVGPVNSNFTTTNHITGLAAGTYSVIIKDIVTNCSITMDNVIVPGTYKDPRFSLFSKDVSCDNGSNGSIGVTGLANGRSPFLFTIVAPSPSGVGTTSTTGDFEGLNAGVYHIMLTDSCGGIQTRTVTVNNYTWRIESYAFNKFSCDSASGYIQVVDSKGNVSTISPITGFSYGVVTTAGDTTWSFDGSFRFGVNGINSIDVFARDSCGTIKKISLSLFLKPSVNSTVSISDKICDKFTATVTGVTNFFDPDFCLYDDNDALISCNTTGIFTGLAYGSYCIKVTDGCTDTTITRCFSTQPPPISIADEVAITNKNCNTFDAAITGQVGLTSPTYILVKGVVLEDINSSGIFTDLTYGDYCILTRDGCRDTTISRCFSVSKPRPLIPDVIVPSYINCVNFGVEVGGDSLTLPTYCLYDTSGNQLSCNTTGIFDSIPLGSYCITIYDFCWDTTITRCLSVGMPQIGNDVDIDISNKTCSTFSATAGSGNLQDASYCLYSAGDVFITCDSSGVFHDLAYGSYYIMAKNGCPDTTFNVPFSASAPIPEISSTVTMSNKTCSTFTARVKGQKNLTNPDYCLIDINEDTIDCNTTGKFENIPYGSYCISIKNNCYDTTMKVCFSNSPTPMSVTASASKSCNYGTSKFRINITGTLPANVQIYNPEDSLIHDNDYTSTTVYVDNIPDVEAGLEYTVVVTDACGNIDSAKLSPVIGYLHYSTLIDKKCPGAGWENGSGNINATVSSNMGLLTVRIFKKNGNLVSPMKVPDVVSGTIYTFNDLEPASYILRYNTNDGCNVYIYDTVIVPPYQYPDLNRSSAYQCDENGFSVGAVATNGVGPFTYEIIGSSPETPSIIAGPQSNPVFSIDNGNNYSLIRLRALDACGNATLGDASILPLANNGIKATSNCFDLPAILSVDTIYNSTYSWYWKLTLDATDSVLVGSGYNYSIPKVTQADTAYYVCHLEVNNGCINRDYYYHITGSCVSVLPIMLIEFNGRLIKGHSLLNWSISNGNNIKHIIVERKTDGRYMPIGRVNALSNDKTNQYNFEDQNPGLDNFYRLKMVKYDGTFSYSKIIFIQKEKPDIINVYPNPATDFVNVNFNKRSSKKYKIVLLNMLNQKIKEITFDNSTGSTLRIKSTKSMSNGIYLLRCIDLETNEEFSQKIIFRRK